MEYIPEGIELENCAYCQPYGRPPP